MSVINTSVLFSSEDSQATASLLINMARSFNKPLCVLFVDMPATNDSLEKLGLDGLPNDVDMVVHGLHDMTTGAIQSLVKSHAIVLADGPTKPLSAAKFRNLGTLMSNLRETEGSVIISERIPFAALMRVYDAQFLATGGGTK